MARLTATTYHSPHRPLPYWLPLVRAACTYKARHYRRHSSRLISMVQVLVRWRHIVICLHRHQLSRTPSWYHRQRLRSCRPPSNQPRSISIVSLWLVS